MHEEWTGKSTVEDIGNQDFKAKLREYVPRQVLRSGKFYAHGGDREQIKKKQGKLSKRIFGDLTKGGKNIGKMFARGK